ncbi:MAG: winged helix-turn-helix domain-containing protein [Actinomycetota bacterium]
MTNAAPVTMGAIVLGRLWVDVESYRAEFAGRALTLSRSQLELLAILAANRNRVVSRDELSEALRLARGRSVDVLLSGLRREIGRDFVRNIRNRGWIVEPGTLEER